VNDANKVFWRIRQLLGVRDLDDVPEVDRVIREEIECYSPPSMRRIRAALQLPDDGVWR
jgi:hypothetical protein